MNRQFRQIGGTSACRGSADRAIDRILPTVRTGERRESQNMGLVEARQRMEGGDGQLVARQRARLIGTQNIDRAASSTAERRVGSTPGRASARAPNAAARVKVAGSATGIEARIAVSTSGTISAIGIAEQA